MRPINYEATARVIRAICPSTLGFLGSTRLRLLFLSLVLSFSLGLSFSLSLPPSDLEELFEGIESNECEVNERRTVREN